MGKPTGFLEYKRETARVLPPKVRIANTGGALHGLRRTFLPVRYDA